MHGVLLPGDRECRLTELDDPRPAAGEVVVAMRAAAICGSDLHYYRAPAAQRQAGAQTVAGHEPAGVVVAVGPDVHRVREGDRVSVYHYRGCGHCRQCTAGRLMWCAERRGYGWHVHGSDADLLLTDERNCLPLPDDCSFEVGALIACNTGTAFSAMEKLRPSGRDTLVVFGLGPVGLNGLLIAKALGARVIGVDVSAPRRRLAGELGADDVIDPGAGDLGAEIRRQTGGDGADCAFETSGNPAVQAGVLEVLRYGGSGVFVGIGSTTPSITPTAFIGKQLSLLGSFVAPLPAYWDIVGFIQAHRLPLEQMITHRMPLRDASEAFRLADSATAGKVMFVWG
jgi:threonine dehydrogenase-like Zn-dependent dehydrogenase